MNESADRSAERSAEHVDVAAAGKRASVGRIALAAIVVCVGVGVAVTATPEHEIGAHVVLVLRKSVGVVATYSEGGGWREPMLWWDRHGGTGDVEIDRGYTRTERFARWLGLDPEYAPNSAWYRRTSLELVDGDCLFVLFELDAQRLVGAKADPPLEAGAAASAFENARLTFGCTLRRQRITDWMDR